MGKARGQQAEPSGPCVQSLRAAHATTGAHKEGKSVRVGEEDAYTTHWSVTEVMC